jgi:hypothetical protein
MPNLEYLRLSINPPSRTYYRIPSSVFSVLQNANLSCPRTIPLPKSRDAMMILPTAFSSSGRHGVDHTVQECDEANSEDINQVWYRRKSSHVCVRDRLCFGNRKVGCSREISVPLPIFRIHAMSWSDGNMGRIWNKSTSDSGSPPFVQLSDAEISSPFEDTCRMIGDVFTRTRFRETVGFLSNIVVLLSSILMGRKIIWLSLWRRSVPEPQRHSRF